MVKGYELTKDQTIPVSDAELDQMPLSPRRIERLLEDAAYLRPATIRFPVETISYRSQ